MITAQLQAAEDRLLSLEASRRIYAGKPYSAALARIDEQILRMYQHIAELEAALAAKKERIHNG